ncbi:hypothetical protein OG21DRAFT_1528254 [Imleria badia]|nr:hypothetical protein OG21DRAFT_1528254 [Imleria badia]
MKPKHTSDSQKEATERWLSKEGVHEHVNQKVKERMRLRRALANFSSNPSRTDVAPPRSPSPNPIASEIEHIRDYLYEWKSWCPSQSHWDTEFDFLKTSSYEDGEQTVESFWAQCKGHIKDGKETLDQVKVLVQTASDNDTPLQKGTIMDLYQITVELAKEVTYFECRLRESGVEF